MHPAFAVFGGVLLLHCSGNESPELAGASSGAPGTSSGQTSSGAGNDGAVCVAKTCAQTEQCGTYDDGCGATLRCEGACRCTPNDFTSTCPPRPCEIASACVDGACQYQPVRCGAAGADEACAPVACDGDGCGNVATMAGESAKLYACGGNVCAGTELYCDPTARTAEGEISYQNRCVPAADGCGACGLGAPSCDAVADRLRCATVPTPAVTNGEALECDSSSTTSSFLYVDAEHGSGETDGSREHPYASYAAALSAAATRNARGIVIAGSPVFTEPLEVHDGISVYGGFDGAPGFVPNRQQRPKWRVPQSARQGNVLRGAIASGITTGTALYHLDIETESVSQTEQGHGVSNVGLWIENATALQLVEITVTAGDAANGVDGVRGVDGSPGKPAAPGGVVQKPGAPGDSCAEALGVCTLTKAPFAGLVCGAGGAVDSRSGIPTAARRGAPVSDNDLILACGATCTNDHAGRCEQGACCDADSFTGGAPGRAYHNTDSCSPPSSNERAAEGGNGTDGANAASTSPAAPIMRIVLGALGVSQPARASGANGGHGGWGSGGGGGGSTGTPCYTHLGGAGGGGGGPGCGGSGGESGGSGGLSVAVAVLGDSRDLVVRAGTFTAGRGGDGGDGGAPGQGGDGGAGAAGARGDDADANVNVRGAKGGNGGKGGKGAAGGAGGAGAAGASVAMWCSSLAIHVDKDDAVVLTAGSAGVPGQGSGLGGLNNTARISNCSGVVPAARVIYLANVPNGNLGGLAGADALCQASPNKPAGINAKAMIAAATRTACTTPQCAGGVAEHVDWVLAPSTAYVRADNTPIGTTNANGIFGFPLENGIGTNGNEAFTGLSPEWQTSSTCANWTRGVSGAPFGQQGHVDQTSHRMLSVYEQQCDRGSQIYCVQQ